MLPNQVKENKQTCSGIISSVIIDLKFPVAGALSEKKVDGV